MTWYEAGLATEPVIRPGGAESERFGYTVDRIGVSRAADVTLADVVQLVRESTAATVVLRYPTARVDWFAALAGIPHRTAIFADNLVYWRLPVGSGRLSADADLGEVTVPAPAEVDDLVTEAFTGFGNHYQANPLFDDRLIPGAYRDWVRRSVADSHALAAREDGVAVGVITWQPMREYFDLLLSAVSTFSRGRGVLSRMLGAVEREAMNEQAEYLVLPIQAHNIPSQRGVLRYGFKMAHSVTTVHLVTTELLMRP